ncbi:hypothetical protein Q7P36_000851 [Cladosporium allicinum]
MASSNTLTLTADEIDDVLYFTRVNEASDLQATITELAQKYNRAPREIVEAAVDAESGNGALHYCAANGLADLFPVLTAYFTTPSSADATTSPIAPYLNRPNAQGSTPLHWAALNGHLPVVKQLVSAGADMWAKNEAGHLAMFEAERVDKGDVVQFLLEAGGKDVERVGNEGGAVSEEDMRDMEVEETGEEGSGDLKMSMGEKN